MKQIKSNNRRNIQLMIAMGTLLFNAIFWQEQLAVNLLLFDGFMVGCLMVLHPECRTQLPFWYVLMAHSIGLICVCVYNSDLSKISFFISFLLLFGFGAYRHRSIWMAGRSVFTSFIFFMASYKTLVVGAKKGTKMGASVQRIIWLSLIPMIIALLFFLIYNAANTVFAGMFNSILIFSQKFFEQVSFARMFFVIAGFYLVGALFLRSSQTRFESIDATASNNLQRIKMGYRTLKPGYLDNLIGLFTGKFPGKILALKNGYSMGIISLVFLNILLFFVNVIDVNYLWFHFAYTSATNLYTMIHEGTEWLIASIVLAMLVLLVIFKGNLNFYTRNKWLKFGAYLWLLQNFILVISVLLRDYYYIREFGLAYKRIGVLFFLVLVIAGLSTVFIKIRYRKTVYYLFRMNAWFALVLLVAGSTIQWDVYITRYNIAHRQTVPLNLPYLLTLSDKILPLMQENLPALKAREKELMEDGIVLDHSRNSLEAILTARTENYLKEQRQYSWLSWNYTDANEKIYFQTHPLPLSAATVNSK